MFLPPTVPSTHPNTPLWLECVKSCIISRGVQSKRKNVLLHFITFWKYVLYCSICWLRFFSFFFFSFLYHFCEGVYINSPPPTTINVITTREQLLKLYKYAFKIKITFHISVMFDHSVWRAEVWDPPLMREEERLPLWLSLSCSFAASLSQCLPLYYECIMPLNKLPLNE